MVVVDFPLEAKCSQYFATRPPADKILVVDFTRRFYLQSDMSFDMLIISRL